VEILEPNTKQAKITMRWPVQMLKNMIARFVNVEAKPFLMRN